MATGIAARVAICTSLSITDGGKTGSKHSEQLSRCWWSLFILDRIHGSSFLTLPAISDESILPEIPPCAIRPGRLAATRTAPDDLGDPRIIEENDDGINSYGLQLLSIWGRLMAYLKTIRRGHLEDAWMANSTYQQIKSEMSKFETVFPEAHRFKIAKLHERVASDLSRDREYWASWVFTQCIYHTIHCTLNHPFLHLARIRGRQRLRSPSFLQHATDQAILHSAWVVHTINVCEARNFRIYDSFIGHLVSIITTVHFFLRFSKEESLAAKALQDFEQCRKFVEAMAQDHPHLANTVGDYC